jgi:hypothetical protein
MITFYICRYNFENGTNQYLIFYEKPTDAHSEFSINDTHSFAVYHYHTGSLEFLRRFEKEDNALEYCLSQYYAIHDKHPVDLNRKDLSHKKYPLEIQKNAFGCLLITNNNGITSHPLGPNDSCA